MTRMDRVIVSFLAAGLWLVAGTNLLSSKPGYALSVMAAEIVGLESFVKKVVQRCKVNLQGRVYLLQEAEREIEIRPAEGEKTENKKPNAWITMPQSGDRRIIRNQKGDLNCG